jgi:hypothetical protein
MVFIATANKGGGVNLVGVLLVLGIRNASKLGNRYGLNAG